MDAALLELGSRVRVRAIEETAEEAAEAPMDTDGDWHQGHIHCGDALDDLLACEGDAGAFAGSSILLKLQLSHRHRHKWISFLRATFVEVDELDNSHVGSMACQWAMPPCLSKHMIEEEG